MQFDVATVVAILSGTLVIVSLACVCRTRVAVELESDGHIDADANIELSRNK